MSLKQTIKNRNAWPLAYAPFTKREISIMKKLHSGKHRVISFVEDDKNLAVLMVPVDQSGRRIYDFFASKEISYTTFLKFRVFGYLTRSSWHEGETFYKFTDVKWTPMLGSKRTGPPYSLLEKK